MANDFSESQLVLMSDLLGEYLEKDDLNQREFGDAKYLLDKIDAMLSGGLDPHDKAFRG